MKSKLVLAAILVLTLFLFPGCRDFIAEEYDQARQERAEAIEMVAELENQLASQQTLVEELQGEIEASKARIEELEAGIETHQATIAELQAELERGPVETPGTEEDSSPPTPLQEEQFRYRGYADLLVSVRVAILNATWTDDKLLISWELTNTSQRRIYLDRLKMLAYDQMKIRGESGEDEETIIALYDDIQDDVEMPWPGEPLRFETEWVFGPLSREITIEFIVPKLFNDEPIPLFTVTRS
jgi:hypothetical protein